LGVHLGVEPLSGGRIVASLRPTDRVIAVREVLDSAESEDCPVLGQFLIHRQTWATGYGTFLVPPPEKSLVPAKVANEGPKGNVASLIDPYFFPVSAFHLSIPSGQIISF
jgi:hypothetical protein